MDYKKIVSILFLFSCLNVQAQTGIGTTTPNASAKLDVYATNKGFLPPRVTLTSVTDATTIASPAEGLLVYNLGSVGLQAGYYYWNGANWATIATATSAGNGVTASDMVKLYDGVGNGATINSTGANFSVTTSGKYSFDFSTSATCGGCTLTLNFQVRDGANSNAVIASDMQTSYNNNVHSEYNGKVEANLIAGRSYNVLVTASSGGIYNNDYTRVYMKQVSGNLPVTGQTVEYGIARYTGADASGLTTGALVSFDATAAGNLVWSGNKFTLKANKTYIIESSLAIYASAPSAGKFNIYDYTNSKSLANGLFISQGGSGTNYPNANTPMKCIITPTSDIQVGIRLEGNYGSAPGIIGSASVVGAYGSSNVSYFMVQQMGSSAIVDPWVLSGANTYNMTGNVGIGNNAPATTLDVTGNINASGNITGSIISGTLSGTANKATALSTARTIAATGDVTFTTSAFDGSSNVTGVATLANSGVTSGTYGTSTAIPSITVDSKGRITAITTNTASGGGSSKAYFFNNTNDTYMSNLYQNTYNYSLSTWIPFVGASLPTNSSGFTRVDNYTVRNTTGRSIIVRVDVSNLYSCSNSTTNTMNPVIYYIVNNINIASYKYGYNIQANNYGQVVNHSVVLTLNNNDTFSYSIGISGGWTMYLMNNYFSIQEL